MIVSDRGSFCSAGVIAPNLLITAGHCVRQGASYRLLTYPDGAPVLSELGTIAVHPKFDAKAYAARSFVIDFALVGLAAPLPAGYRPIRCPRAGEEGVMGARYADRRLRPLVRGDGKTGGALRQATLTGVPLQSDIQLRFADPAKRAIGRLPGRFGRPGLPRQRQGRRGDRAPSLSVCSARPAASMTRGAAASPAWRSPARCCPGSGRRRPGSALGCRDRAP